MARSTFANAAIDDINEYNETFNDLIDNIDLEVMCSDGSEIKAEPINDNFLNFIDQYCNESLINTFTSFNDNNNKIDNSPNQCDILPNFNITPDNSPTNDKHPHIVIINQSHQNVNSNIEITNLSHYPNSSSSKTTISTPMSPNFNFIDDVKSHFGSYESVPKSLNQQPNDDIPLFLNSNNVNQTIKKDENFHKKLLSLLDIDDINKLSGDIYSLEYYRSCNRLLALRSRPLASLRQSNRDAERKHKELIDLNKKCRSIIRKFKNGPLTIDTLFKWNEQRSLDGPMSCSVCRCNKFFKRPGSIANHIYRVHRKILQEALESGELSEVVRDSDGPRSVSHSKLHLYKQNPRTFNPTRNQYFSPKIQMSDYQTGDKSNVFQFNHLTFQMNPRQ